MITTLPRWLRDSLELHGIENDQLSMDGEMLAIRCDTFDEAFGLRDAALTHAVCHLSVHPITFHPVVNIQQSNQ